MGGYGFPYSDDVDGGEARFEHEARMEEHDRELAARDRREEMAPCETRIEEE